VTLSIHKRTEVHPRWLFRFQTVRSNGHFRNRDVHR
jgi:hypothetical protein